MSKARTAAFHALRSIADGRADLPTALARSRAPLTDLRDRALAMDIVTGTVRWQRALEPLWRVMAGGCRVTRRTLESIERAGFTIESVERASIRKAVPIVRPSIRGVARK